MILSEHNHELADSNDPNVAKATDQLLSDIIEFGKTFDLSLYNPRKVFLVNDDIHSIFRIFPNGIIIVSTVI